MKLLRKATTKTEYHEEVAGSKSVETTTMTKYKVAITPLDLLALVRKQYPECKGAKFTVGVPGGGDWSNCDLDVDANTPVVAEFETHT